MLLRFRSAVGRRRWSSVGLLTMGPGLVLGGCTSILGDFPERNGSADGGLRDAASDVRFERSTDGPHDHKAQDSGSDADAVATESGCPSGVVCAGVCKADDDGANCG